METEAQKMPEQPPQNEVHYAEQIGKGEEHTGELLLRQIELPLFVMVLLGLLAVPAAIVLTLTGSLRANLVAVIASYAAILIAVGIVIGWKATRSASAPSPRIARYSDQTARVRWVGSRGQAAGARPVDRESFEPVFFRAWFPSDDPSRAAPRLVALGVAAVVTYSGLRFADVRGPALIASTAFAVAACAVTLMLLFPTWYRFVPGRLDIMRFSLGRHIETESIDLRSPRLLLQDNCVHIAREEGARRIATPLLRTTPFHRATLHAATCAGQAPDLPMDRLLG